MSQDATQQEMDLASFMQLGAVLHMAEGHIGNVVVEVEISEAETVIRLKRPLAVHQGFAGKTPQEAAMEAMRWLKKVLVGEINVEIHPVAMIPPDVISEHLTARENATREPPIPR